MTFDDYIAKAKRALASAQLLLDDDDTNGACNRAYYAMFNAAFGALVKARTSRNLESIKTHTGLISAFGEFVVKPGLLPISAGQTLNQVERVRLLADYTDKDVRPEDAAWSIEQARVMLDTVESRLG